MPWSYSGNPASSDRDEVRFLVGDTDQLMPLLADEEIDYLLAKWQTAYDSNVWTASIAASAIANKFAGVVSINADGVSVQVGDLSARYAETAIRLREQYKSSSVGGEVDVSNLMYDAELDPSIKPLLFGINMHDNRWAGQQNFGGTTRSSRDTEYYGAPGESSP